MRDRSGESIWRNGIKVQTVLMDLTSSAVSGVNAAPDVGMGAIYKHRLIMPFLKVERIEKVLVSQNETVECNDNNYNKIHPITLLASRNRTRIDIRSIVRKNNNCYFFRLKVKDAKIIRIHCKKDTFFFSSNCLS